ncbi:hypothetical protein SAMN05216275_14180 [Streptosporangium canum]|uniref:Uncharacterized protein n=1 Tax=Streptosporangium canum TaxID=324952 RepID=A0A1I4DLH1_9ACTN|nr:hypothetical protein [Streptosporangium canum]SFK92886.1 hypothetical protein SAMN05216275_14180 [Streptosporangium canum]
MGEGLRLIGSLLVVVTALLAWACVIAQVLLARWWQTSAGRHVFVFQLVLALCTGLWALRLLIPDGDWFQVARLVAFTLVPWVLGWRFLIILQTWRKGRRQREEHR